MPYRPPGGRDWNKNGTYDWFDRLKDYRAYEIVTGNKHPLDRFHPVSFHGSIPLLIRIKQLRYVLQSCEICKKLCKSSEKLFSEVSE